MVQNKIFGVKIANFLKKIFQVIVDNLKEGENYKITVATMVDGYTTDKHATQVETFADTTQTLLFPLDEGVTIEEAQDEVIFTHTLILCK